jgi:hypothetical protein
MNVIDCYDMERDFRENPVSAFSRPALGFTILAPRWRFDARHRLAAIVAFRYSKWTK